MGFYENEMMNENRREGRRNRQNADCGCWNEQETSCEWNAETSGCACQASCAVQTDCGCAAHHEHADGEAHIWFESCDGAKEISLSSECQNENSLGRVLDVNMTLRSMCPGRRAAVGMHLMEVDEAGVEFQRGFRAVTVPAHNGSQNRDVALPAVRFIIPEDVNTNGCRRHFVVRAINHYMDEPGCWRR